MKTEEQAHTARLIKHYEGKCYLCPDNELKLKALKLMRDVGEVDVEIMRAAIKEAEYYYSHEFPELHKALNKQREAFIEQGHLKG